jgi:hypothetical protein
MSSVPAIVTVPTASRAPRKPESSAGPSCLAWLEQRPDGLYRLRCNIIACDATSPAKAGPLYLRRAA